MNCFRKSVPNLSSKTSKDKLPLIDCLQQSHTLVLVPLPLLPDQLRDAASRITQIGRQLRLSEDHYPGLHTLRLALLPPGDKSSPQLLLSAWADSPADEFLSHFVEREKAALTDLLTLSPSFKPGTDPLLFLWEHRHLGGLSYLGHPCLSLPDIRRYQALYHECSRLSDSTSCQNFKTPAEVRSFLLQALRANPNFSWALQSRPQPHPYLLPDATAGFAVLLGVPLLLLCSPLLLLLDRVVRHWEREELVPPAVEAPPPQSPASTEQQNEHLHLAEIRPGLLRQALLCFCLFGNGIVGRIPRLRRTWLGINTLHFVKWTRINHGSRLLFLSDFDGSTVKYISDFVDRSVGIPLALNGLWTHCHGYPETRRLLWGGAQNAPDLLRFLSEHRVPTLFRYSSYPDLSNADLHRFQAFREGLAKDLSGPPLEEWLDLL